MELVYLFSTSQSHERVETYCYNIKYITGHKRQTIVPKIQPIKKCGFIVTFDVSSDSCEAARDLSDLNIDFNNSFKCRCLVNGASAYFNKRLFPKMNRFERMLREYIYLKQQISIASLDEQIKCESDEQCKKSLSEKKNLIQKLFEKKTLEEMDFTEIYTKLFIDSRFCDEIKRRFFPENIDRTATAYKATKREYLEFINQHEEHIIWSDLSEGKLEIIRLNYEKIKTIRNGIMHAHNIDYNQYHESEKLLNDILKDLQQELSQLISLPNNSQNIDVIITALRTFASALDTTRSDFERGFNRKWLEYSHSLEGVIDEEVMNELLGQT